MTPSLTDNIRSVLWSFLLDLEGRGEAVSRLFLADAAERVARYFEREYPGEPILRRAVRRAREVAVGRAPREALDGLERELMDLRGRVGAHAITDRASARAASVALFVLRRKVHLERGMISALLAAKFAALESGRAVTEDEAWTLVEEEAEWFAGRAVLYLDPYLALGEAAHRSRAEGLFPLEGERGHVHMATYLRLLRLAAVGEDEVRRGKILSKMYARDFTILGFSPERGFYAATES